MTAAPRATRWRRAATSAVLTALTATTLVGLGAAPAAAADSPIEYLLKATNDYRASNGAPALRLNPGASGVAQTWSETMRSRRTLAHNPDYASQMPSGWTRVAENVAYACGYGGQLANAKAIMRSWKGSSGHARNMRGGYSDIGIGFAYHAASDCAWATQDFGTYATASTYSLVGTLVPPAGMSRSALSNVTVVATGNGVTRTAKVSGATGGYVLSGLKKGTYTVRMKSSVSGITSEYLTDAASTRCANRIGISGRDRTDVDAKLTSGSLASPAKTRTLCDVSANTGSTNFHPKAQGIGWIVDQGLLKGWPNGQGGYDYRANDRVTRIAFAAMLYRYAGSPAVSVPSTSPFTDIKPSNPHYKAIVWLKQQGIVEGYRVDGGKREFRSGASINRGTLANILFRYADLPDSAVPSRSPFADLSTSQYLYDGIAWAGSAGVIPGWNTSDGRLFKANKVVDRAQLAKFMLLFDRV